MRILSFLFLSILTLNALEIENFRTDLYSKNSPKILKKIELNLSLQGENLKENEIKIKDSLNTVISSFFYEDLFTELGKNKFKDTLIKFMAKKYNLKVEQIYIVSLNSVQEFDLEEFKRFLENTQNSSSEIKQKTQNESKKIQKNSVLPIQQIDTLFNDENAQNADINLQEKLGQKILNQIQENNKSKDQNLSGFELRFDPN